MALPFSASADRNKQAIGDALSGYFEATDNVFEVGSGTGQHAVYFSQRFSNLQWQPTDRSEHIAPMTQRIAESGLGNIAAPMVLDVAVESSIKDQYSLAYSANTAHIMSLTEVASMFNLLSSLLKPNGYFALYGPFSFAGKHTSDGNESFDAMLKQQSTSMGIRDKSELDELAFEAGLDFHEQLNLPANNCVLVWRN